MGASKTKSTDNNKNNHPKQSSPAKNSNSAFLNPSTHFEPISTNINHFSPPPTVTFKETTENLMKIANSSSSSNGNIPIPPPSVLKKSSAHRNNNIHHELQINTNFNNNNNSNNNNVPIIRPTPILREAPAATLRSVLKNHRDESHPYVKNATNSESNTNILCCSAS